MAKPYRQYAKEILGGLHYGATWTPGTPLKLGQIGTFEDGVFVPKGHLSSLGIDYSEEKDTKPTKYTYISKTGASLLFKAKGQTSKQFQSLTELEAGVRISFSRQGAVVFSAANCLEHRIANILSLQNELAFWLNSGMWQEDWAVITHLVAADSATIVLSSSRGTAVELQAASSLGEGPTKMGDISTGVTLSYTDSMNQLIVAEGGLTPLFHSVRLKRDFWSGKPRPILNKHALEQPDASSGGDKFTAESFETVDDDE